MSRYRDNVKWLVVGVGDVALKRVFPALSTLPRNQLYGVVTRDEAKGKRHSPRVWTDLETALTDNEIDAVYLATPVSLHAPQAIASLRAGKHVLCEKPIALDFAQAQEMVTVAEATDRILGVAYFRRYYPKLAKAKRLLDQNVLGKVVLGIATCSEWFPEVHGDRNWFFDPRLAGSGPLYDIGSHRVDALNFLLGRPISVIGRLSNTVRSMAVEDNATVMIEYENGARGILDARWNTRGGLDDYRIVGTEGAMELSPLNGPALRYPGGQEFLPCAENRHSPCIEGFTAAILDGKPLDCAGRECLSSAWVLDQAVQRGKF